MPNVPRRAYPWPTGVKMPAQHPWPPSCRQHNNPWEPIRSFYGPTKVPCCSLFISFSFNYFWQRSCELMFLIWAACLIWVMGAGRMAWCWDNKEKRAQCLFLSDLILHKTSRLASSPSNKSLSLLPLLFIIWWWLEYSWASSNLVSAVDPIAD